jgi:hypothetical protein
MQTILSIVIFAACYLGLGHVLNTPKFTAFTWGWTSPFRFFSMAAIVALPFLIVAGGVWSLVASGLAGLMMGVYGRKLGLDRLKAAQDAEAATKAEDSQGA